MYTGRNRHRATQLKLVSVDVLATGIINPCTPPSQWHSLHFIMTQCPFVPFQMLPQFLLPILYWPQTSTPTSFFSLLCLWCLKSPPPFSLFYFFPFACSPLGLPMTSLAIFPWFNLAPLIIQIFFTFMVCFMIFTFWLTFILV